MTVVIPTGARVIEIDLDTAETNVFKNVPYETHEQFYSTDIGMAFLKFTGLAQDYTGCTARLTLINFNDGSKVQRIFEMDTITTFVYPMLETELVHAGRWIGQLAVIKNGTTISDNPFRFKINGPIMSTALISFDNINTFTSQLTTIYDGLNTFLDVVILDESGRTDAEGLRETKEGIRQSTFEANEIIRDGIVNSLVTAETIAQKVAEKYQLIEAESANRLLSVEQQLADTLNKSAITLTHMFADNTARDAYFVAHPTELVELQFVKVGTGYQQYIEGVWTDSVPIVAEQVSATNQPIIDTGNYFTTDKTNAALQELGAHKVSTSNPHGVTKSQVGLGNVDNTSDANKPVSTAQQTALNAKANKVQEDWITPTLLNGWVAVSGYTVAYRKNEFGRVETKGSVTGGKIGTAPFQYLTGYRPLQSVPLSCRTATINPVNATMSTGGGLTIWDGNNNISLDSVTFPTT